MKTSLTIFVCLCSALPLAADERLDLIVADGKTPGAVRLEIVGEAQAWNRFLDRLFDHFDRDGDGSLSVAEAGRIFPLPGAKGKLISLDLVAIARKTDGKIARDDFKKQYRAAGFTPLAGLLVPPSADNVLIDEAIFLALDRDRDGRLSSDELAQAVDLLRRFDEDEDEVLTQAEILRGSLKLDPQRQAPIALQWQAADPARAIDLTLQMRPGAQPGQERWRVGGDDKLSALGTRFELPGVAGLLLPFDTDPTPRLKATREFYLSTFRAGLGGKAALAAKDTGDDPALQIIETIFPCADRDGDGRLTLAETEAFLQLIESGMRAQRVAVATDTGSNLFTLLDDNHDGKLDRGELLRARELLGNPKNPPRRVDLKRQIRISVREDRPEPTFGPVRFAKPRKEAPAEAEVKRRGPLWFQAMDRNQDGYLSPQEFLGPPTRFEQLDSNHDGRISIEEAESADK